MPSKRHRGSAPRYDVTVSYKRGGIDRALDERIITAARAGRPDTGIEITPDRRPGQRDLEYSNLTKMEADRVMRAASANGVTSKTKPAYEEP